MNASPDTHTPDLAVIDSRGLTLRRVAYQRASAQQARLRRTTLERHDLALQCHRQWDPRQAERMGDGRDITPNQILTKTLGGRELLDESTDAGWQLVLHGEAGQVLERWDARGSHWQTTHDELLRPVQVRENAAGQASRIAECFTYGQEEDLNRRGRLVRHDDEAGSRLIDSYALSGEVHRETRHFLADLDLPDWPEDPDTLLEPGPGATSVFVQGPLAEVLEQTDALDNRQVFRFNPGGELAGVDLTLHDGSQHPLLVEARYNAFGQVESQTAGNDVTSRAGYDPATGRLRSLSASRPGRSLLQDLYYEYDPVGNVTSIEDRSQPVSHFANQRVEPLSTFVYDSLYQLIEASGREAAGASIGPGLPDLAPDPGDTSRLLNYQQFYSYDASGNLLTLRHVGQQSYTREMAVAEDSNRAVPAPGNPLSAFDANGNLLALAPGQPLQWNASNQLHGTRQVARGSGEDDEEHYRYGGDGLRVRKVTTRLVSGSLQRSETRYLPGLELHSRPGESVAAITAQAGRCAVRCLHWQEGQPDGIANPQLRYSLGDLLDSSSLELDGEAQVISHEGYYPFGGTAWWAARSATEAGYKTQRYSGKERDSSGLYDYGLRYYAPWLMRWINPDPAGDVDGLNRYCMVRNNPIRLKDANGLTLVDALDLASKSPDRAKLARAYERTNSTLATRRRLFSEQTQQMLDTARRNSDNLQRIKTEKQRQNYLKQHPGLLTLASVRASVAHAGVMQGDDELYESGLTNLSASLSPRNLFPGVLLLNRKSSLTFAPIPNEPPRHLGYYLVVNSSAMLKGIREAYAQSGTELHPYLEKLIREHIEDSGFRIPIGAGIPGMHAEVRALNTLLQSTEPRMLRSTLSQGFFFTERLVRAPGQEAGSDFPACFNCSGILPRITHVVTGRVTPEPHYEERTRSTSPTKHRQL